MNISPKQFAAVLLLKILFCGVPGAQGQNLYVGSNSSGESLAITSGTNAYSNTYISYNFGDANNRLEVDGPAFLTNSGNLYVGYGGSGEIAISGGVVSDVYAGLGRNSNSSGSATVSGGLWSSSSNLYVGYLGEGSLNLSAGTISDHAASLGRYAGSSGAVVMTGGTWTNAYTLSIGDSGSGFLSIAGGSLSAYTAAIGVFGGSTGVVTMSGGYWSNTAELDVGLNASGSFTMTGGEFISAGSRMFIGWASSSIGNMLVSGGSAYSRLGLAIGNDGSGVLTVAGSGTLEAGQGIKIAVGNGSTGVLNIGRYGTNDSGGTLTAQSIVFGDGIGQINFNQSNSFTLTSPISGHGFINQNGVGTTTISGNSLSNTAITTVNAGTLNVTGYLGAGAPVQVNGGTLCGGGVLGNVSLDGGGIYPSAVAGGNAATALTVSSLQFSSLSSNVMNINASGVNDAINTSANGIQISGGILNLLFVGAFDHGSAEAWTLWTTQSSLGGSFDAVNAEGVLSGVFTKTADHEWILSGVDGWGSVTFNETTGSVSMQAVPEPSTCVMFTLGAIIAFIQGLRRIGFPKSLTRWMFFRKLPSCQ